MFKRKSHVGRPSNEELRNRKIKKIIMVAAPVFVIVMIVVAVVTGNLTGLMGNSTSVKSNVKKSPYLLGDFDMDGRVTQNDVKKINDYINGSNYFATEYQVTLGDVNGNGQIDTDDATIIQAYMDKNASYSRYYEQIGIKKICQKGYNLKNNQCILDGYSETTQEKKKEYFTVRFDANGGYNKMDDLVVEYDKSTQLTPNSFAKDGYIFAGWTAERSDGTWQCYSTPSHENPEWRDKRFCEQFGYVIYENGQSISRTANPGMFVTMHAQWASSFYTVRYQSANSSGSMSDQKIVYGAKDRLHYNLFKRDGYSFVEWHIKDSAGKYYCNLEPGKSRQGWADESVCKSNGYVSLKNEATVYNIADAKGNDLIILEAQWTKKEKTTNPSANDITLKFDGGEASGSMPDQIISTNGGTRINPNKFTFTGYGFNGWKVLNQSKGNKYECTVNGKRGYYSPSECGNNYVIYKNNEVMNPLASAGDVLILYAQWKQSVYTIAYNANGGNGKIDKQTVKGNQNVTISSNKFKKDGYTFTGWRASKNGGLWYCYTDPSKQKADWTYKDTCGNFGFVYFNGGEKVNNLGSDKDFITMEAQWKIKKSSALANSVVLKFEANGGTKTMPDQIISKNGGTKINENKFVRSGYVFSGWKVLNESAGNKYECIVNGKRGYYTPSECGTNYVIYKDKDSINPISNGGETFILYAQWDPKTYTIKYDKKDGSGSMGDQKVAVASSVKLKKNSFTRDKYNFTGWRARKNQDKWYCYTDPSKQKAGWLPKNTCESIGYYYFADGATVKGLASNGETVTMEAQWKEKKSSILSNTVTLEFNANGGTNKMPNQSITVNSSAKINANKFTMDGYVFDGWKVLNESAGNKYDCIVNGKQGYYSPSECGTNYVIYKDKATITVPSTGNTTLVLYAQWKPNTFTIKFDSNNTQGSMSNQVVTINSNTNIKKNAFHNKNLAFAYWNLYNNNDKTWYCYDNSEKTSRVWKSKDNCKYGLVEIEDGERIDKIVSGGKTITAFANWSDGTFTIMFNSVSGSGSMPNQIVTFGKVTTLRKNAFEKDGYVFDAWNAQRSDGTWYCYSNPAKTSKDWMYEKDCNFKKVPYKDQAEVAKTAAPGDSVTMYAQWVPNTFMVVYDAGGGTKSMKNQTIEFGKATKLSANKFEKEGKEFAGWHAKRDDGTEYCYTDVSKSSPHWVKPSNCYEHYVYKDQATVSQTAAPGHYVKMIAQWKKGRFTVKFNSVTGKGTMSDQVVNFGEPTALRKNTFTKDGYIFDAWNAQRSDGTWYCYTNPAKTSKGWRTSNECDFGKVRYKDQAKVAETAAPGKYVTMYAQWIPNMFTVVYYPNGGSNSMSNQYITYGKATKLSKNLFKKPSSVFGGWYAQRDDGTEYCYTDVSKSSPHWVKPSNCYEHYVYKDQATVSQTAAPGHYVKMYAQWKPDTFTIVYDGKGATSGSMANQKFKYGVSTPMNANQFRREGYKFLGWHARRSNGTYYCYTNSSKSSRDWVKKSTCEKYGYYMYANKLNLSNTAEPGDYAVMEAQWKKKVCTIQYRCRQGTPVGSGPTAYCHEKLYQAKKDVKVYECPNGFTNTKDGYCSYSATYLYNNGYSNVYGNCNTNNGEWLDGSKCKKAAKVSYKYGDNKRSCPNGGIRDGKYCYAEYSTVKEEVCN